MKFLKIFGYVAFFIFSLLVGLYLTFPWNEAKDRILEEASAGSGAQITAKSLEPSWITGAIAKGLKIKSKGAEEPIEIPELKARAHLFQLIRGNVGFTAQLPIAKGEINADVVKKSDGTKIVGTIEKVELALMPGLKEAAGVQMAGQLSLDVDLFYAAKEVKKTNGILKLKGVGVELLKGGKLPVDLSLGDLNLKIPIKNGVAKFNKEKIKSDDIEVELDGEILLLKDVARSSLKLTASFKPSPDFLKKEPLLGMLLNNLKRAKGSDGFYTYALSGSLKYPRPVPKRRR